MEGVYNLFLESNCTNSVLRRQLPVNVSESDWENKTKKSGPANSGFDSPEKPSRILGAMVDIGLGPTFGFYFVAKCYETITSSRPD